MVARCFLPRMVWHLSQESGWKVQFSSHSPGGENCIGRLAETEVRRVNVRVSCLWWRKRSVEESPIIRSHEAQMKVTVGIGYPDGEISVPARVGRVWNTSGGMEEENIVVAMAVVGRGGG